MMVAEEEEKEAEMVVVVMCSINGPLEAWGCYAMIFAEIH